MKKVILILSILSVQYTFANSCNIEEGYYLMSFKEKVMVKVDSCHFSNPNWGPNRFYRANFNQTDINRAKRELLAKHRHLVSDKCQLLGTGDVEIVNYNGFCNNSGTDKEAMADFNINYKCHLF